MKFFRITLFLTLASLALSGCGPTDAPEFSMEKLDSKGDFIKSSELRGNVVLIDFWATWCGPCKESMPYIASLHNRYQGRGLKVVGLSNELRADVEAFEKLNKSPYSMYLDSDNSVNVLFQVKYFPTVVVLGKDGQKLFQGHPGEKETLESVIESALKS